MIYIILAIVVVIGLLVLSTYNSLVRLNNKVEEAFSTMDVYLKKRWELIPNLVEVVKGYANYEKNTFTEIIKLRNNVYNNMSLSEKIKTNKEIDNILSRLMIISEGYPELKSNNNFKDLSNKLVTIENEIANARKYYNAVVRIYNNKVEIFPSNICAKILGYKTKLMFQIEPNEKANVSIKI